MTVATTRCSAEEGVAVSNNRQHLLTVRDALVVAAVVYYVALTVSGLVDFVVGR